MSDKKDNEYKYCNVKNFDDGIEVSFKVLGERQDMNNQIFVPENPTVRVPLLMIKGVVKRIRQERMHVFDMHTAGIYYHEDNLVKIGKLDYEVLFTDNVKLELYFPHEKEQWIKTEPLIDTKTGIKFYHISEKVYSDLSELIERNSEVVSSKQPETIDL